MTGIIVADMEDDFDVLLAVLHAARSYLAKLDSDGMADDDLLRALVARFDFDTEARP